MPDRSVARNAGVRPGAGLLAGALPGARSTVRTLVLWSCCILAWAWGLAPRDLSAHRLNNSRTAVRVTEDSLRLELAVDETDLAAAFALDRNGDGILWRNEMVAGIPEVSEYVEAKLRVEADGEAVELVRQAVYVDPDNLGNLYLNLRFGAGLSKPPARLDLYVDLFERFTEGHKNLVAVTAYGGEPQPAVFSATVRHHCFVLREDSPYTIPVMVAALAGGLAVLGLLRSRRRAAG